MLTEGVSLIDSRSDRVVMEPNPTYWNPARRPTVRIVYDNVIGKAQGIQSVAAGDGRVDVVFDLTPDEAHAFPASEHGKIQTKKAKTILTGVFNENRPDSPWRHVEARRALNLAIDRQVVLDHGAHGYGTVIPAFIQPGRYGADPGMSPFPHDPEAAKAVLEAAGVSGRDIVIVASPAWKGVVEAIGQCLAKVGLGCRFVSDRGELPDGFDVKLEWYFDWTPQYPWPACTGSSSGRMRPCARVRRIRSSTPLRQAPAYAGGRDGGGGARGGALPAGRGQGPVPVLALHPLRGLGPG